MQILFVATNLPVPPNSGQSMRSLSIIKALASSGHDLSFLSFASKNRQEDLHPLSSFCHSIELLNREMKNLTLQANYSERVLSLLKLECYSIERFRSTAMQEAIRAQLNRQRHDLIICDGIYSLANIPKTRVPILLNCHNVEHVIIKRYAQLERNPIKKCYAIAESNLMRSAEQEGCRQVAGVMVCSEIDRKVLQTLRADLPMTVIPNVVDTDSIQPNSPGTADPILLFQGVMDWYPNRDAVEFFVRGILPEIRAKCPAARFVVAGRNPPTEFVDRFSSDTKIEFTGTVPDMRPHLASATIVVVPLRVGGGTRIKILEACAAGKPVVSTAVGAEGLELEPGKEILLADNPTEFAHVVSDLIQNPLQRKAIAESARRAVVARYSQVTLKTKLDNLLAHSFGK
jgi:polysaccharide biosynthesis protein PslH